MSSGSGSLPSPIPERRSTPPPWWLPTQAWNLWSELESRAHRIFVENQETVCAGAIAGGALIGIAIILVESAA